MTVISLTLDEDTGRVLLDAVMAQRAYHEEDAVGSLEGSYAYTLHTGLAEELERLEAILRKSGCGEGILQ